LNIIWQFKKYKIKICSWASGCDNEQTTATATGLPAGNYEVTVTDSNGCYEVMDITVGTVGLEDLANIAKNISVYPNPAMEVVNVAFELSGNQLVEIVITDLVGRRVKTLKKGILNKGKHVLTVNREELQGAGIYLININIEGNSVIRKVIFGK